MLPQEFVSHIVIDTLKPRPGSQLKCVNSVRVREFSKQRILLEFDLSIKYGRVAEYCNPIYERTSSFNLYKSTNLLKGLYERDPFARIILPLDLWSGDWSIERLEYARYRATIGLVSQLGETALAREIF